MRRLTLGLLLVALAASTADAQIPLPFFKKKKKDPAAEAAAKKGPEEIAAPGAPKPAAPPAAGPDSAAPAAQSGAAPAVAAQDWSQVTATGWLGLAYSSALAIVVAYILWNFGVQRIGSARTAIYNNLTPVIATFGAAIFLGEPLTLFKIVGAVIIFVGLYLARTANIVLEPEG